MTDADRLKTYIGMTETTRKWVSVMDTKAAFISALNVGLLSFIWTGAKLMDVAIWNCPKGLAVAATAAALASLLIALHVVLPRVSLKQVFGRRSTHLYRFRAISFYGFVSEYYPKEQDTRFLDDVKKLDEAALIDEALEQHFMISHVVQAKSNCVARAGLLLQIALFLTGTALFMKVLL